MKSLIQRFLGFGLSVVVTFTVGIATVPMIIVGVGARDWAGVVVAQSVATVLGVFVGVGWSVTGPSMVATVEAGERPILLRNSLITRFVIFVLVAPLAVLFAILVSGIDPVGASLAVLAYLLQALGAVWYFVGESRPMRVFLLDTVPRSSGVLAGAILALVTNSVIAYTACLLIGGLAANLSSYAVALKGVPALRGYNPKLALKDVVNQRHGVITAAAALTYAGSPPIVASVLIPQAIEPVALAYKLYTFAINAMAPAVQVFQGWIPAAGPEHVRHRTRIASRASLVLGLGAGIAMTMLLPFAAHVLSAGQVDVGWDLGIPLGVSLGALLVWQITGLAGLTALGRSDVVARSTTAGCVIGLLAIVGLGSLFGGVGILSGLAVAEIFVATVQLTVISRELKRG